MLAAAHKDKYRLAPSVAKRKRDKRYRETRAVDRAETSGVVWSPCRATASRRRSFRFLRTRPDGSRCRGSILLDTRNEQ